MKKIFTLFLVTSLLSIGVVSAQKMYATKTGQIGLNASGTVDIKAMNNQVDSKFADKTGQIIFNVLIKAFKFPNGLMEDHFNENYMESTKFPKADFKGFITNIATVSFDKDGTYNITVDGALTIHGVSQKVSLPGILIIEKGKVTIKGNMKVKLKDFITGSYIGSQINEQASLTINCIYE